MSTLYAIVVNYVRPNNNVRGPPGVAAIAIPPRKLYFIME